MYEDYDYLFKVLVTGDSGVGKSCLMLRFSDGVFNNNYICTIGVDFRVRQIKLDEKTCRVQIWDTAGQERFKSIITQYYRGAHGVIVVYDVTDMESFLNVKKWLKEADEHSRKFLSKLLVGNKSDLDSKRVVNYADGKELADSLGIQFMETSAKSADNVEKAFMAMCADIKSHIPSTSSNDKLDTNKKFEIGKTSTVKKVIRKGPCDC